MNGAPLGLTDPSRSFRWLSKNDFEIDAYRLQSGGWFLFVLAHRPVSQNELQKWAESFNYGEVAAIGGAAKNADGKKSQPLDPILFVTELSSLVEEDNDLFKLEIEKVLNPGLFLDQALNRSYLRSEARVGQSLLNLFCYTSSFSVAAARRGVATCSVDVSARYLNWSKENFKLNKVDLSPHRFIKADAREFMRRELAKKKKYDWIILDPPTFSRSDGVVFQIQKHLAGLLADSLQLWSGSSGAVLVSCNDATWPFKEFKELVLKTSQAQLGKKAQLLPLRIPAEFNHEHPLKGFWISLS